mmetsp:Transcript_8051/g.16979  ORF Transcript_8051/g.16979 Transcript_8051/m.16979 type:complete len:869 (-) Transcript_8051:309-2915(-)
MRWGALLALLVLLASDGAGHAAAGAHEKASQLAQAPHDSGLNSFLRPERVWLSNTTALRSSRSGYRFPRYDARLHDGDEVQLESTHNTWLSFTTDPSFTLRGRNIALKAANTGQYCAVMLDNAEGMIRCDQSSPPFSAWLEVSEASGKVSIKGTRGGKFCVDRPGGIKCNSRAVSGWEVFSIVDIGGGKIGLRGGREGKLCADKGIGIVCDVEDISSAAAAFETVSDEPLWPCVVQTKSRNAAATFVVRRPSLDSPHLALLCKGQDHYLEADLRSGALRCQGTSATTLHSRRVSWWDMKTATFQAPLGGDYLQAADPRFDVGVRADSKQGNGWALWKVLLTGGYEDVRPLIRGVNLGNWFLLERWMTASLFFDPTSAKAFEDSCSAMDEHGLMKALGPEVSRRRMEDHWSTWITEEDITWLANHGVNAVRVPFGYWMVFPTPPFVHGQFKYLERLFHWCEAHRISILLDFHGLKGSQTGNPTSGNCGACGNRQCGKTHLDFLEHEETNLAVISKLTEVFSPSPAYLGFAVANEVSSRVDSVATMDFYQKAYNIIRSRSRHALISIFATFNPSTYPFPNFQGVAEDVHIYFGMGFGKTSLDQSENLVRAENAISGLHWPILVGEWSLGASGQSTLSWSSLQRDAFFADYARMQLQAWETHSIGWFYWSYKTGFRNSTWNFRDMCDVGWLPGCTPGLRYASDQWLTTPLCAYRYLDGKCQTSSSGQASALMWIFVLALVGAILISTFYLFRILKPPWTAAVINSMSAVQASSVSAVQAAAPSVATSASVAAASAAAAIASARVAAGTAVEAAGAAVEAARAAATGTRSQAGAEAPELFGWSHIRSRSESFTTSPVAPPPIIESTDQPFIW